jgi:hypothetical protein
MQWWRVCSYRTDDGTEVLARWHDCLDYEVQTIVEFTLKNLEVTEDWFTPGDAIELDGAHAGLTEIRLERELDIPTPRGASKPKERYRLVGFILAYPYRRSTDDVLIPGDFIILLGCQKWRDRTAPPKAFDWALQLKQDVQEGRGFYDDHSL